MLISEQIGAYCSDVGRLSTAARGGAPQGGVLAGVGAVLSAAERFEFLLRGRKPYTWAQSVALSRGAIHRLQNGSFPDPEKLVPACRVENISLSWWLDGIGAPYIVYIAANAHEHAVIATTSFADEHCQTRARGGNEHLHTSDIHFCRASNVERTANTTTDRCRSSVDAVPRRRGFQHDVIRSRVDRARISRCGRHG
jgi:hypothetical protein